MPFFRLIRAARGKTEPICGRFTCLPHSCRGRTWDPLNCRAERIPRSPFSRSSSAGAFLVGGDETGICSSRDALAPQWRRPSGKRAGRKGGLVTDHRCGLVGGWGRFRERGSVQKLWPGLLFAVRLGRGVGISCVACVTSTPGCRDRDGTGVTRRQLSGAVGRARQAATSCSSHRSNDL